MFFIVFLFNNDLVFFSKLISFLMDFLVRIGVSVFKIFLRLILESFLINGDVLLIKVCVCLMNLGDSRFLLFLIRLMILLMDFFVRRGLIDLRRFLRLSLVSFFRSGEMLLRSGLIFLMSDLVELMKLGVRRLFVF